jgi:protein O-GlcNAc transferase
MTSPPDDHPELQQAKREMAQRQFEPAAARLRAAIAAEPGNAVAHDLLADVLTSLSLSNGDFDLRLEGLDLSRRAVELAPGDVEIRKTLIDLLGAIQRVTERAVHTEALLRMAPDDPASWFAHAGALQHLFRDAEAREIYRAGLERHPESRHLASAYAQFTNYDASMTPAERLAIHRRFGEQLEAVPLSPPRLSNTPDPARKLRVGFVSADFRHHSCAYFLEPLLQHLDRSQFDIYCYMTSDIEDHLTKRFRALAKGFRVSAGANAQGMGFKLWNDRIDVLFDLAGHTIGNHLGVFHGRPAPVQATYLGYPNTTGLRAVDYRFIDSITDPPGAESAATEHLVRLDPCFLCYQPSDLAPDVAPLPMLSRGHITFGSFNNPAKLNPTIITLWARLLRDVPNSRLYLKAFGLHEPEYRDVVRTQFAIAGAPADSVTFATGQGKTADHLASYAEVDVALDPHPYNGTTTTCEAAWMGVPTITLTGDCHAARVGASLMNVLSLPDFIAHSPDAYVAIARRWAAAPDELAALRAGLRERMRSSPLCDAQAFAARFGAAVRACWQSWCAAQTRR